MGTTALVAGRSGPTSHEKQFKAGVVVLPRTLGEVAVEIRVWNASVEGDFGPSRTLR